MTGKIRAILFTFFAICLTSGFVYGECKENSVLVKHLSGKAFFSLDQKKWTVLTKETKVLKKYFVKTEENAQLQLEFPDGSVLKVGDKSMLNMKDMVSGEQCERKSYKVKLFFGKVWSSVKKLIGSADSYTVESKNAVAGVRGTSFGFIVNPDESGAVMVLTGAVDVAPPKAKRKKEKMVKPKVVKEKKDQPLNIALFKKNRSKKAIQAPKEITKKEWESYILTAMQMVKFDADGKISKPVPIGDHNADSWYMENSKK